MTALLAVHVSTSVHRVQFQRAKSIQSTRTCASTAVVVQVFVLQRLSTKDNCIEKARRVTPKSPFFCLIGINANKMKNLLHIIIKSAMITAIGIACYYLYVTFIA